MSDEQHIQKPNQDSDFGAIQISSKPSAPSVPAEPVKRKTEAAPKKAARRTKKTARSGGRSWLWLALPLLLLSVLLLCYLAGVRYLLPPYIKGELAGKLARELGRPVTVGQASLSPFTFALHLGEISLGPAAAQPEEPELARIAALDARLRPVDLLHGQVVLDDVRIDRLRANLLRRQDGSFNALPPGGSLFSGMDMLPDWLQAHGLRLQRSTVHFLDQPSGKRHLIEHIEFVLPADAQGAEPSLSAVVNSSPLQIIGQQEGGEEARLTFKLDEIDPQQYLSLFPSLAEKLNLSAGRADVLLEIILHDKNRPGQGPAISGELTFSDLLAQSANAEEQPKQAFRLTAPKARLMLRANPLKNIYTIEELLLEEPRLSLPENQQELLRHGEQLAAKAAALLNYGQIGLAVDNLSLSKGQVQSGATAWQDINLELTGFQNAKASGSAEQKTVSALSLVAASKDSSFSFKGSLEPQGNLSGSLSLKNVAAADLLQPYLSDKLHLSKGMADIAGELRLDAGKSGSMTKAAVTLRDFRLQQGKAELLSAKLLQATDCALDRSSGMVCGKAVLEGAIFADADVFLSGGKTGFSCADLELKQAAANLRLGGIMLPLSDLNLRLKGLPGQLDLKAAIGKWGGLEISGKAERGAEGLNLTGTIQLRNAGADLLRPYLADSGERISFLKGGADLSGALRLEQGKLHVTDGTVALRNFVLQRKDAALLSGKSMKGAGCNLDQTARSLSCASISVDEADFADSNFFLRPAGRLHLAADKVEIKNSIAVLKLAGAAPLALSGLNLSMSGLRGKEPGTIRMAAAAGGSGRLEISGTATAAEAGLAVSGSLTLRNMSADLLNPYLAKIRLSQGRLDISGSGSLNPAKDGHALNLSSGTVQLHDFVLQGNGAALLSGKSMSGEDCALDHSLICASINVQQTDFAAQAPAFFLQPENRLGIACNELAISDSNALLPVGAGANRPMLPLSSLNMRLNQNQQNNLRLEAGVGGQGSLRADGTLNRDGSGAASLTGSNLDIRLFNKAFAGLFRQNFTLQQGRLNFDGHFSLPESRFSGQFSIDDLAAGSSQGDSLSWQKAAGSGAVVTLSPFKAAIDQFALQAPAAQLASSDSSLPTAFFALFQELPPVTVEQCSISSGRFNSFSGIQGTAAPLKAGSAADFSLHGSVNGGQFSISGTTGRDATAISQLTAERLPLAKVAQTLAEQLNLKNGSISRTIKEGEDRLDFAGFVPKASSDYALTLALLTDQDGAFTMPLQSMPFAAAEETISATAADKFKRLRSQCHDEPWTVLDKLVPDISKARKIDFIPGDKVPDFMNSLNSLRTLFSIRPHAGWAVQGCYDAEADAKPLLAQIQKNEVQKVADENIRRQKEMERLIAIETERQAKLNKTGLPIVKDMLPEIKARPDLQLLPMPQAELPEHVLPDLAAARAAVVREHLISKLGISANHVQLRESAACGAQAALTPVPIW